MKRGKRSLPRERSKSRYLLYVSGISLLVMIGTFVITFMVYNNKLRNFSYSGLTTEKISSLVPNLEMDTEEASSKIGKTINEAINEVKKDSNIINEIPIEEKKENLQEQITEEVTQEVIPDPTFIKPVEGEIIKEFAKDNLVYSLTLDEWVTHYGIDIKADRTTVIKAAEKGTITAIKNDPRYGLTIILEHVNGYKTVYSNLLTTEFVTEGEIVEEGQSLGTVGNSAVFEISDEPHLHFEILIGEEYVNPTQYF